MLSGTHPKPFGTRQQFVVSVDLPRYGARSHDARPWRAAHGVDWATICTRLLDDANDQAAWAALEARVRVWAFERLRDLGSEAVEDAVADMCTSVVLDLAAARGPETFRGFVLGKCLNVAKGAVRLAAYERVPLDRVVDLANASQLSDDDPRFAVLDACLERLPERDRRAVELRFYAEARAEQIALELRVSAGNARRIVFNGVNRLRKCAQAAVGPLASGRRG
jgi:RNA polymerase sigma factor (sigma-70 family)